METRTREAMVAQPQRWFHNETIDEGRIMSTRDIVERLRKTKRLLFLWCILAGSYWLSVLFGLHMVLGGLERGGASNKPYSVRYSMMFL